MNIEKLKHILKDEPGYRVRQALKSVYVDLISDWQENTTLPKALREELEKECPLVVDAEIFDAKKGNTVKALITLEDGKKVETVLMRHSDGRNTVCVSSQVGCPMRCTFCATGMQGFSRHLTADEIIVQVLFFARYLKEKNPDAARISNIVFMGMGEPFLNYDNVMQAIHVLNDKDAFGIGARHISISTCGLVDVLKKFMKEPLQLNLAISLHAPNEELRTQLMPINQRFSLQELMKTLEEYVETRGRQVMFEYLMIDGVNDKEVHARQLAGLMQHPLYMVNLIRYNPTGKYKPSQAQNITKFKNILMREGIRVTQRHTFGQDIDAACGQLAGKKKAHNQ